MAGRLDGKRALIVGGTSGIGLASAHRFIAEGARVVIVSPDAEQGEAAAARLRVSGVGHFVQGDATQPAEVTALFREATESLGGLDVLFHVTGGSGRAFGDRSLHESSDAGWLTTLRLNLTSVFLTNREALRWFLSQNQPGVVLNMSSVLAEWPSPEHFDSCGYTAAKGGIISMSRLAAARYAAQGIRVNVLAPGLIDTPMSRRAMQDPTIMAFVRRKQPLFAGSGSADDCAAAAVFLCSDEARGITGLVLPVDGGWSVM